MNKNEDLKNKLPKKGEKKTAEKTEKHSPGFLEKTKERIVTAVDQNKDGRIDIKDLTSVSRRWSEKRETSKREAEINLLRPLFEDDLEAPEFNMPKMIRLVGMDKRHAESEVCIGSIGHESDYKGLRIVNIYPEYLHSFGLTFYPDLDNEVYYVDPCDRNHYIALDEYFNYLKIARLSELQKIAQDLGAKHFRVTYKEYAQSSSKKQALAKAAVKTIAGETAKMNAEHSVVENNASKVEIAAEMHFLGHKPVQPTLLYFKKDPQIQNLISFRMSDNTITHQIYTLKMSNTSGIKSKDAASIDAALSSMKANVSVSVEKEAESENNRYFEYEIDF